MRMTNGVKPTAALMGFVVFPSLGLCDPEVVTSVECQESCGDSQPHGTILGSLFFGPSVMPGGGVVKTMGSKRNPSGDP